MSKMDGMGKFSPITASLLVRKGEAGPSVASPAWLSERLVRAKKPDAANDAPKPRRLVVNLSPREYETLGLIAVKKGTTRHDLAQEALHVFFDTLADELGEGCLCIEACQRGCD